METIKCINCDIENEAKEEITSGLKLKILTSICKCGQLNMEYKDKFYLIPQEEKKGILRIEKIDYEDNKL